MTEFFKMEFLLSPCKLAVFLFSSDLLSHWSVSDDVTTTQSQTQLCRTKLIKENFCLDPNTSSPYLFFWNLEVQRHTPVHQMITLALFPLEIRLKCVSSMGHSLYPANHYKSLPDVAVKDCDLRTDACPKFHHIQCGFIVLTAVRWNSGGTVLLHACTHSCRS